MTISDSLPIKFYLTSESTFNESDICGAFRDCFCSQVNNDELLTLQFIHTASLTLSAYNKLDDTLLNSQSMDSMGGNFYQLIFTPNGFIGSDTIKLIYFKVFSSGTELARTDCVVIGGTVDYGDYTKSFDLDCGVTIHYTNSENFDNLLYEISPQPEFQITIPAQFQEEENPQDREDLELSNGEIVTLRQTIQQKRKLKIGWMPNEYHLKLQKIFMHDTIIIDGDEWRVRDPYESTSVNRYRLKKATILLTLYNSVQKNTL
jgi:hypothetical protein